MKKKKIIIYSVIFIVLLAIALGIVFFLDKASEKEKSDKQPEITDYYSFEKRMYFSIPDYAEDFVELQKDITEEEEVLDIKTKNIRMVVCRAKARLIRNFRKEDKENG